MGIGKEFFSLMNTIGYTFSDVSFLECALTHISYSNEMKAKGFRAPSNETLEFLGDAVLELIISEELYKSYARLGEGALTKMRQQIVCEKTLASIARGISLGEYLNIGTGEEALGIRNRDKVLADATEALISAIYLDNSGKNDGVYKEVILSLFKDAIKFVSDGGATDYKTKLQQFVEKNGESVLRYEYQEMGPEHDKDFFVTAYINNNLVGKGDGKTKRQAEANAARMALKLFGIE